MNGVPLSLDMATSTSAMGKVMVAQAHGNTIPDSWGVNAGGHRTTRPDEVIALLPLGGAKGYGLGVLVEILGGVLTGASIAKDIGNMYKDFDRPQNVGHYMLAIHIPHFMPIDIFKERMGVLASMLRSSRTAPGVEGIMIPGEPEEKVRQQRHQEGIPLADVTVQELTELGQQYGVPFPPPLQTSPQQEHT
jgi:LDH2 family malate/lactate/ureidoglycolate dehydrogenase